MTMFVDSHVLVTYCALLQLNYDYNMFHRYF